MADLTDPDRYAYLAEGNATQARKRVAVKVLLQDTSGNVLLVNPTYKEFWDLPGGMAEANEPPTTTARRELSEELDLTIVIGALLTVAWVSPHDPWDDQLILVFAGGRLTSNQVESLHLPDPEIDDFTFTNLATAKTMLRADIHDLLTRAHQALADGTSYHEVPRHW
jgi:8-oxo-dGTP pyrophosphatase MutT (NUDIX family)